MQVRGKRQKSRDRVREPRTTGLRPRLWAPGGVLSTTELLDRGHIMFSWRIWNGVHSRAYPDPTNKKNLNAFMGRVFLPQRLIPVVQSGSGLTHGTSCGTG